MCLSLVRVNDTQQAEKLTRAGKVVVSQTMPSLQRAVGEFLGVYNNNYDSDFFLSLSESVAKVLSRCESRLNTVSSGDSIR